MSKESQLTRREFITLGAVGLSLGLAGVGLGLREIARLQETGDKGEVEIAFEDLATYQGSDIETRRQLLAGFSKALANSDFYKVENAELTIAVLSPSPQEGIDSLRFSKSSQDTEGEGLLIVVTSEGRISRNVEPEEQAQIIRSGRFNSKPLGISAKVENKPILIPNSGVNFSVTRERWVSLREGVTGRGPHVSYTARDQDFEARFMRNRLTDTVGNPIVYYRFEIGSFSEVQSAHSSWHAYYSDSEDGNLIEAGHNGNGRADEFDPRALFEETESIYNDPPALSSPRVELA